ncbi:hypothetical protein BBIA_0725 [Bifidobacterium biavatii DSM 23969]|uniref:Uncharacterized protein n=1 Tax=Bifidobacterium biavatii DSM 23969 TaxID=1437608 RepID=A0A086ZZ58_9BIFI|nr:hypothetical protein BBIA_0725 [Bifidobacterium biavatii DSM 23969]
MSAASSNAFRVRSDRSCGTSDNDNRRPCFGYSRIAVKYPSPNTNTDIKPDNETNTTVNIQTATFNSLFMPFPFPPQPRGERYGPILPLSAGVLHRAKE